MSNTSNFTDYELLDFGEGRRIERIKDIIISRPDNSAIGMLEDTRAIDATFDTTWILNPGVRTTFNLPWEDFHFVVELAESKQVGLFPEQEDQWFEFKKMTEENPNLNVLNLFGYSGVSSIVFAKAGATVTHVDSSSHALSLLEQNEQINGIKNHIRKIKEDVLKFLGREVSRGNFYDVILADPPVFGRGEGKSVWRLENNFEELIDLINKVLSFRPKLILINVYSDSLKIHHYVDLLKKKFPTKNVKYGELALRTATGKKLVTGNYFKIS